ncbi:MAG: DUF1403 family protein [Mesorhizobium sp.]|nr:MAG: DUF1403 family protein [Mesorhizobium sp.]
MTLGTLWSSTVSGSAVPTFSSTPGSFTGAKGCFEAGGKRIRPGENGFERAVCVALVQAAAEACRLATELSRRAEKLIAIARKAQAT